MTNCQQLLNVFRYKYLHHKILSYSAAYFLLILPSFHTCLIGMQTSHISCIRYGFVGGMQPYNIYTPICFKCLFLSKMEKPSCVVSVRLLESKYKTFCLLKSKQWKSILICPMCIVGCLDMCIVGPSIITAL